MLNYKILMLVHVKLIVHVKLQNLGEAKFHEHQQSFTKFSKIEKKCNFNKMFKISIGQKHNESIKVLI